MGVYFFRKWQCVLRKCEFIFFENGSLFYDNVSLVFFLKMGVCFFESGSLFFRKWEFVFSKMGVCFFMCDLQCELLISGLRLSRTMSVVLSGYTVVTVLFK